MSEVEEMAITSVVPWYGGKRTMARTVIEELGPHTAFWEPFCGGISIILTKPQSSMETINDLHADLVNLAKCLQHRIIGPQLYRRLRRDLNSQSLFKEARERCKAAPTLDLDLDRAHDYFLTSWQGMNGVAGTLRYNLGFARRLTKNGGHAARRFASVVDTIPKFRRRLRQVTILQTCGIQLCDEIEDADGVAIYVDAPYIVKGAKYLHDFPTLDEEGADATKKGHIALAKALRRFTKTRVVVSYYEHPSLAELYPGWTVRKCPQTKALVSQGRRNKSNATEAPEVLLINGPSYASAGGLFA